MDEFKRIGSENANLDELTKKFSGVDKSVVEVAEKVKRGEVDITELDEAMKNAATTGSKFSATLKSIGANIGISLAISAAITLIKKLATSYSEMVNKAREATNTFKEQTSSIESNKQKITELRESIDSGNLSYSEAAEKRKELLSVQRELLSSYGSEVEGIDLVNGSLEEQIALLDEVTEKNRQAWKNSVNELSNGSKIWNWATSISQNQISPLGSLISSFRAIDSLKNGGSFKDYIKNYFGYEDSATKIFGTNIDKITKKVENFKAKFKATDNTYLNNLIKTFNGVSFDGKKFTIEGNVEDVSNTITTIQSQLKDIPGYTGEIDNQLKEIYNDAQKIATESLETYKTAIQKEILDDNSENGLKQYYMNLSEAYQQYENALVEGDESAIEKAKSSYSDIMNGILSSGMNERYADYFSGLYPELKSVVDDWNFETKITPNLDEFKNNKLLKEFSIDEISEQFREGGNNLSDYQEAELEKLNEMAAECGMSLDDFLSKLNEVGAAQSQVKKDFLEKIDFSGRSNADPVKQYLSGLANEEYTLLLDAEIPISSKTWLEKDWENFIEQLKFKTGELTIDFNPETAFNAMTTALSEQSEKGYLKDETMQSLKSTYGDLTDILTYSENGIVLNTEAMVDLTNQTAEAALVSTRMKEALAVKDYQKAARQLNNYKKEHVGLEDALNGSTSELNDFLSSLDETERVDIQNTIDQMQTLSDTINGYDALEAKIRATTSALNDYVHATSTANNADNFDTARGGLENAKKMYENGWTGKDDYKTYIDYIGKYNEEMNNYQSPEDYFNRAKRYLTEDISGIYNFLDDAAKLDNGWVTNANGQYDIAINDLNKFAEDMDMSLSFVTDMLLATTEAWDFDVDFSSLSEGLIDGLNAIDLESENARTNLNEFKKTIEELDNAGYDTTDLWNQFHAVENEFNKDIQFTLSISDMSEGELLKEAENVADDIAKAIGVEEIKFDLDIDSTDNLIKQVKDYRKGLKEGTDEYNKAQIVMAQLIQQKQELEKPAVMSVDTTGMSDEMSGAIALVQQWIDASNELERTQALGLDTTQAQAQLDSLTTKLSSVSSTTLANLGLNISGESSIEEIKSQISSIDVNALAKDTNVKITADFTKGEQSLNQFKSKVDNTIGTIKIDGQLTPDFVTDLQRAINSHTYNAKINATVTGGNAKAEGSAHAEGSAYVGGKGKWTVGVKDNNALVGEEGYEIRVRDGIYETIGQNGAEFTDVRPDDIIFNHKQSEELLKYGHTNSRGKSFVKGSAYNGGKESITGSGGSGWKNKSTSTSTSKSKSKSKDKDKKSSKTQIDWIERKLEQLQKKIDLTKAKFENLFSTKSKSSNLDTQLKQTTKLMNAESKAADKYKKKASSYAKSSGLSKSLQKAVQEGRLDKYSLKDLIKKYGEETANKIQEYQKWFDKYQEAQKQAVELKTEIRNLKEQQYQLYVDEADAQTALLDAQNEISTDYNKQNDNLYEKEKALKTSYEYQKKIAELTKDQTEIDRLDAEYNKELLELQKEKFDNIRTYYENKISLLEAQEQSLQDQVDIIEAKGMTVNANYYKDQINIEKKKRNELEQSSKELKDQLKSITYGTAQWYEAKQELEDVNSEIKSCTKSIAEMNSSITKIADNLHDKVRGRLSDISTAMSTVAESFNKYDMLNEDTGVFTDEGFAMLGVYASDMNAALSKQKYDSDTLDELTKKYNSLSKSFKGEIEVNGRVYNSREELFEAMQKYTEYIQNDFTEALSAQNSLIDMMVQKYEAELSALDKLIKAKKKALQAEKDLHDYQKSIRESTDNATSIQKQIAALQGDKSEETTARIQRLQNELKNAQEDLSEKEYNQYISDQQDMLDKLSDEFRSLIENETKNRDKLLVDAVNAVNNNTDSICNTIKDYADRHNYNDSIGDLKTALMSIQTNTDGDSISVIIKNMESQAGILGKIQEQVSKLSVEPGEEQYQEEKTNNIFSEHGTGYHSGLAVPINDGMATNNELSTKLSNVLSANNVNNLDSLLKPKTHALKTLYDSDIKKKVEKIFADSKYYKKASKKKASDYKTKINQYLFEKDGKELTTSGLKQMRQLLNVNNGGIYDALLDISKQLGNIKNVGGFSKGGIVKVPKGEDGLVGIQDGEGILTPVQTAQFQELISKLPELNIATDMMSPVINVPSLNNLSSVGNTIENKVDLSITLPNVKNYSEFISQMQRDPQFEKMVRSMSTDQLVSGNRFAKNKYRF